MTQDPKRELLRHLVATIAFRGRIAIREAPENFSEFSLAGSIRTPGEILAHIGDLLQGSVYLLKGEMVQLNAAPLSWDDEVKRFLAAAKELDAFLAATAGEAEFAIPVERLIQGPVADALTHVGQIVILRRAAGAPVRSEPYFTAEIGSEVFERD